MRPRLTTLACSLATLLALGTATAGAQDYPTRPLRLVIGFTAGGPTDIPGRFLADRLGAALGQTVVVENKPGAGAMLAMNDVLAHPRDGYNLLLCTYFDPVNTVLYRKVKYKLTDFVGVSLIAKYGYAIAAANALPVKTFADLVQYTKDHPTEINYGHLGIGSTQNILAKRLEKLTGMKMTAIPYKGAAEAMAEIVAGRNHFYIGPPIVVMPLYEAKQVKVLAVTGAERLKSAPEVPTLQESGIPFITEAWLGVCAGAGTPQPVVDLLNSKIVPIVNSPEYRALVEKSGSIAVASTPKEFQKVIEDTASDAAPIIKEFGLELE